VGAEAKVAVQKAAATPPILLHSRLARAAARPAKASSLVRVAVPLDRAARLVEGGNRVADRRAAGKLVAVRQVAAKPVVLLVAQAARVVRAPTPRVAVQRVARVLTQVVVASPEAAQPVAKRVEYRTRAANQGAALQVERAVNRAAELAAKAARTAVAVRAAVGR
jgi:hypothetical protein